MLSNLVERRRNTSGEERLEVLKKSLNLPPLRIVSTLWKLSAKLVRVSVSVQWTCTQRTTITGT